MAKVTRVEISGFKSIARVNIELAPLNVLIGANGSGKSNFASFFSLLAAASAGKLSDYVIKAGGANSLLHYGAKVSDRIQCQLDFESDSGPKYVLTLLFAPGDQLAQSFVPPLLPNIVADDSRWVIRSDELPGQCIISSASIVDAVPKLRETVKSIQAFHFHDTSETSPPRLSGYVEDNQSLHGNSGNLAAVLYKFQQTQPKTYQRIVSTIRTIAPFFDDFVLAPQELNPKNILLNWRERNSDYLFGPHQISDGTLRAMALVTLLLQPPGDLSPLVILDEPELGLHPAAINLVAGLLKKASHHCQLIVSTQSAALVDCLEPEDVIVVDRREGQSEFRRLTSESLEDWLKDYTLGQLWEKNVLGGGPFA